METTNFSGKGIIERRLQVLKILWFAFIFSIFMVVMIKESLSAHWQPQKLINIVQLTDWSLIISVFTLIFAGIIRKKLFYSAITPNIDYKEEKNLGKLIQKYFSAVVVSLAISEAVAFYGLIAFMIGADNIIFYTMIILSLAGMIYFRPKSEEIYSKIPAQILNE